LTDSTGDREKMAYQRFTVNVTSLCSFHQRNGHRYFCGPTILWARIGKRFWRRGRDQIP